MKQIQLITAVSMAVLLCSVTFTGTVFFMQYRYKKTEEKFHRLAELDYIVQQNYYTDYEEDDLIDSMLKGYISGLGDKYSNYMTPDEYGQFQVKESGQTVGIGVTVMKAEDGYPLVVEVQKDSPAEKSGILPDDKIIAVEGEDALTIGFDETISRVKGEEGTTVNITVLRNEEELKLDVARDKIEVVTAGGEMLDGHIGYIYITNFRENTSDQFLNTLNDLIEQGADALIFDVRDNGGGLLSSLEIMLDPLLPEGNIATATYHKDTEEVILKSDAEELNLPIAILVNGNTASAAELFSASLRDFKQAKLVGTQTFGKGIMQATVPLDDGGGLTLTIARYQTTKSECYHGVGLTPDIVVELDSDSETDSQLETAKKLFE